MSRSQKIKFIALVLLLIVASGISSCAYYQEPETVHYDSIARNKIYDYTAKNADDVGDIVITSTPEPVIQVKRVEHKVFEQPVRVSEEDFNWENIFGVAGITQYLGDETSIILPDTIGGFPLGVICEYAFAGKPLTCVIMPDTVTEIRTEAFDRCTELVKVQMHGAEYIGDRAFAGCISMDTVFLPSTLKHIGRQAFASCAGLEEVKLTNNMESIGEGAFLFSGITSINFPGSLEEIPKEVCYHCDALENVTIESGVKSIDANAFGHCGLLKKVVVPSSVENVKESSFIGVQMVQFEISQLTRSKSLMLFDFFFFCLVNQQT